MRDSNLLQQGKSKQPLNVKGEREEKVMREEKHGERKNGRGMTEESRRDGPMNFLLLNLERHNKLFYGIRENLVY